MSDDAGSPFTQMRHVGSSAAKAAPYRAQAASSTSATVVPGTSSWPVPAASRADANSRRVGSYSTSARPLLMTRSPRLLWASKAYVPSPAS